MLQPARCSLAFLVLAGEGELLIVQAFPPVLDAGVSLVLLSPVVSLAGSCQDGRGRPGHMSDSRK